MPVRLFITLILLYLQIEVFCQKFILDSTNRISSYEVLLNSRECDGLANIKINLFDTTKLNKFELISKTIPPKYIVQNETILKNIPRGYYDLNSYDENNEGDAIKNIHIGMTVSARGSYMCSGSNVLFYKYFYITNGIPPFSLKVTSKSDSTLFFQQGIMDSVIFSKDSFDVSSKYIIKDACGDSILSSPVLDKGIHQINTDLSCSGILKFSLKSSGQEFSGPLPSLKYTWTIDSNNVEAYVLTTSIRKDSFLLRLNISDTTGCQTNFTFLVDSSNISQQSNDIDLIVDKILSCSPDSNYIRVTDKNSTSTLFMWNTGDTNSFINPKTDGIYKVFAKNSSGCTDSASISFVISHLTISADKIDNTCFARNTASITIYPKGGISPLTYFWTDSVYSKDRTALSNGNYRLQITDSIGCRLDTFFVVKSPPPLNLNLFARAASCAPAKDGKVESMAFGGTPPYDVQWNNGLKVFNVDTLAVGFYKITVTDNNKCTTEFSFRIDDLSPLRGTKIDTLCAGGSITIGSKRYSSSGRYIDTLTSKKGCDSIHVTQLVVNPLIDFSLGSVSPTCSGYTDGSITVGSLIGDPAYTYYLNDKPVGLRGYDNLSAGNYIVKLQDRFGCFREKGISISNPEKISFTIGRDTLLDYGDTLKVKAITNLDISKIKSIKWKTTPMEADCSNCGTSFVYRPKQDHTLTATLENLTGCKVEDEMLIRVNLDFKAYLPNVFSPSLSNYSENKRFTVLAGRQVIKVKYLRIFNRLGDQVYEAADFLPNDFSIGWDGTFKGADVSQGVYVYLAEVEYADGRFGRLKGDVTILR